MPVERTPSRHFSADYVRSITMSFVQHVQDVFMDILAAHDRLYLSAFVPLIFGLRRLMWTQHEPPERLEGNFVRILSLLLFSVVRISARLNKIRRTKEFFFTTPLKMLLMTFLPCFKYMFAGVKAPRQFGYVVWLYSFASFLSIVLELQAEASQSLDLSLTVLEVASDQMDNYFTFDRQLGTFYATSEYLVDAVTWVGALLILKQPLRPSWDLRTVWAAGMYIAAESVLQRLADLRAGSMHSDYRNFRLMTLESHLEVLMGTVFNGVADCRMLGFKIFDGRAAQPAVLQLCWHRSFIRLVLLFSFMLICMLDSLLGQTYEAKFFEPQLYPALSP